MGRARGGGGGGVLKHHNNGRLIFLRVWRSQAISWNSFRLSFFLYRAILRVKAGQCCYGRDVAKRLKFATKFSSRKSDGNQGIQIRGVTVKGRGSARYILKTLVAL